MPQISVARTLKSRSHPEVERRRAELIAIESNTKECVVQLLLDKAIASRAVIVIVSRTGGRIKSGNSFVAS